MVVLSCWAGTTNAQLVNVINEEVATGALGTIPAGYSTYRIYALLQDPTDRMSAVFGSTTPSPIHHLKLGSSSDSNVIWNSSFGGATADAVNCGFYAFFPDLARDSWVTIGASSSATDVCVDCIGVQTASFTISSPPNMIQGSFAPAGSFGPDLLLVDGAWFLPNDNSCNGFPTGVDNRVLIAQVTIPTGTLEYQLNLSVFDESIGAQQMIYVHLLQGPLGMVGNFPEIDGTCLGLVFPVPTALCPTGEPGCTDPTACNYDPTAATDDGTCEFLSCAGCTDVLACNYDPTATLDDGTCTFPGCNNVTACNFDADAGCSDGSCTFPGCTDATAANFDQFAGCDDGSCLFPGCTDDGACNFDPGANLDDGSCTFPGCTDDTACNFDADAGCNNGTCTFPGCTDDTACNFIDNAGCDDGSCTYPGCTDAEACNYDSDAGCPDGSCTYPGCIISLACNFNPNAGCSDGSCTFPGCTNPNANNYNPNAGCDDGSCTFDEFGCTDDTACNYDPSATTDDGSCTYPGCNDPSACNFEIGAGCNDGSCNYPTLCGDPAACNYDPTTVGDCSFGECTYPGCTDINACNFTGAGCDDGSCEYDSCSGCTDPAACNYDPTATINNNQCDYSCYGCTNDAACNFDPDATIEDGSCDFSCYGCTNDAACNFDPNATIDDGSCDFDCQGCTDDSACNFDPTATEDDGSCVYTCFGCTDADACNFDPNATIDNGSCDYSCLGCTDDAACNFDAGATIDDGSCTFPGCTDDGACNFNANAGCDDGSCTFPGCNNPNACNYDADAGCNDGSCTFPGCNNDDACNFDADAGCNDGSCTFPGCTDPNALNYDADAGCDDGSCEYDPNQCFFICPADAMVECDESTDPDNTGSAFYEGGCTSIVSYSDSEIQGDECHYWFTRTWCGIQFIISSQGAGCDDIFYNDLDGPCATSVCSYDSFCCEVSWDGICADEAAIDENCTYCLGGSIDCDDTCEQVIHVHDTEAPVFTENPVDITVTCQDLALDPAECVATDNCSEEIIYDIFTSETGECIETCTLSVAYGPGPDWSIWLPELAIDGLAAGANYVWSSPAYLVLFADGTAHLWGDVVNTNDAGQGWHVNMWFENAVNWADWSALGRSYKDDLNLATPTMLYEDWTYLELVNGFSTLTGLGDFAGSALYLSHFPYDYYYGFQCGFAANNKNSNFGMSGWFAYDGWVNGETVEGNGDLNVDKSCSPCLPLDCPHAEGEITQIWMATDGCGNVAFTDQVITIDDDVEPVFENCPDDVTVDCYDDALLVTIPLASTLYGFDNCDTDTLFAEESAFSPEMEGNECLGSVTYTWEIVDCSGNRTECSMTVSWNDNEAPEFTFVPDNITVECDLPIPFVQATAEDNCGTVTVEYTDYLIADGGCDEVGYAELDGPCAASVCSYDSFCCNVSWDGICANEAASDSSCAYCLSSDPCVTNWIREFIACDECGNCSYAYQYISVVDTNGPVFTGDNTITVECSAVDNIAFPEVTDACNEFIEATYNDVCISGGCPGGLQRTWYAVDLCGNETTWVQYITIFDNTPPVIVAPTELNVDCYDVPTLEATAYDACEYLCLPEYDIEVNSTSVVVPGDCIGSYDIVITWTAIDYCENPATATTIIHVTDTNDPYFTYCPPSYSQECDLPYPPAGEAIALDSCDTDVEIIVTDEIEPGDCPNEYTIVRIYRAYDDCGNEAMCVQEIEIVDTTAPVFTFVPDDITVECELPIPFVNADAEDNCGLVTIEYNDTLLPDGGCDEVGYAELDGPCAASVCSYDAFCCDVFWDSICANEAADDSNCAYCLQGDLCTTEWLREFIACDECDNCSYAYQLISVVDTTPPVISGPIEVFVPCDDYDAGLSFVTTTDNCNEVSCTWTDTEISATCEGHYIRDYVCCDACGNCSTFQQIITLVDDIDPVIVCGPPITVECDDEFAPPGYSATDNCDDDIEVTTSVTSFTDPDGCITVLTYIYTAYDNCGNTDACSTTVTITDYTDPIVTAPADDEFSCDEPVIYGMATATDNCDEVVDITFSDSIIPSDCPQEYVIVRTWYGTDNCGNVGSDTNTYTIYDNEAPVLVNCPDDLELDCEDEIPAPAVCVATDNCDPDVVVTYSEQCYGECPIPGQEEDSTNCDLLTPAFPAVESDCNYPVNWAMVLFNVPTAYKYWQIDPSAPGQFVDNGDGTATITASMFNVTNPNGGFFVSVLLENGMDWPTFDSQPYYTNYKSDCVDVGTNYLDWLYYYMSSSSTLTGWGDYEGSFINLAHAPSNLAFAYQIGLGANNFNENYGSGGWFTHDGVLVDDSNELELDVDGAGDIAFEHNCCNDYTLVRTWCAEDCAHNMDCCTQVIVVGNGGTANPPVVDPGVENPGIEKPIDGNFEIMGVSPNPAKDQTTIEFTAVVNNTLTMDVYDMAGRKIAQLYHGKVEAGQTYRVSFDTNSLEDGLYNIRLFSLNDARVKRLIIAR